MRNFVHRENIKHYRRLLDCTTEEAERRRILDLLAEEEAKLVDEEPKEKKRGAS